MGKLSKYLFGIMAAAMLAGCSDELPTDDPGKLNISDDGSGFFMALDIQMPGTGNGSRSSTNTPNDGDETTSTGGVEVGQDYENNVTSALIVLAAKDDNAGANGKVEDGQTHYEKYGFIAASTVLSNRLSTAISEGNKQYKAVARLQKANLEAFYGSTAGTNGGREVYVFVFCNPTTELSGLFEGTTDLSGNDGKQLEVGSAAWMEQTCSVIQGNPSLPNTNIGIWGSNSFLMNNVKIETRLLPENLIDWEKFTSPETAFHLSENNTDTEGKEIAANGAAGAVKVQRSVARFDFRDGSRNAEGKPNDNTYPVLYTGDGEGVADSETGVPLVNVQIQKMCLVNMSNSFYYLPRVSDYGMGDDVEYCMPEKSWKREGSGLYSGGNYVVGPYWSTFANSSSVNSGFGTYFNFPFFADTEDELVSFDNGNWDVVEVADVLNGTKDNYDGSNGNAQPDDPGVPLRPGDFTIWRYVTENVIPWPTGNQKNGISTGIVFKARLLGADIPSTIEEEYWCQGAYENLSNCLNGKPFTYEGTPNDTLTGNTAQDPILYYYDGHLYLGWRNIRQAAIQAAVTQNVSGVLEINRSNSLYKAVFGDGPIPPTYTMNGNEYTSVYMAPPATETSKPEPIAIVDSTWPYGEDGKPLPGNTDESAQQVIANYHASSDYKWMVWHEAGRPDEKNKTYGHVYTPAPEGTSGSQLLADMRLTMTTANITLYQSSVDTSKDGKQVGYYCYYYYWNRHNDNNIAGTMAPMEFSVVRNNVYKLSVDKISRLGHPRIPDNDPDNPTPQTPDESDKIYLDVKVQIIPWVVRVNSIVF